VAYPFVCSIVKAFALGYGDSVTNEQRSMVREVGYEGSGYEFGS
jgi:hypothetical protein